MDTLRRALPSTLFFVLTTAALVAAALLRPPPSTVPGQVAELAAGVYFRHGDLENLSHCNNGFVVLEDFVVVVDANFPSGAEAALADIRKLTSKPVRFVFDTHHHGDHAYGNPVWRRSGALPVAHEKAVTAMNKYEPQRWQETMAERQDVRDLGLDRPMPPVVTYPDRLAIDDGTRRLELLHFGTAHTEGDGFLYLPQEKILFTGDTVVNGPYNYMGDGDTASWLRVLDTLLRLDVEVVAPGHGPCSDASLIRKQRDYIAALRRAVREGVDAARSLAELQETVTVPEELRLYVGRMFKDQIEKIHSEMTSRG